MPKIIKGANNFKPTVCKGCGCVYAFEEGDYINLVFDGDEVTSRSLECPICGTDNELKEQKGE